MLERCAAKAAWMALVAALMAGALCAAYAEAPAFDPQGQWREHVIEVSAEAHAAGEYTLQDAFNDLPETGGTVSLGEGEFVVVNATAPEGRPVRLVGKGPGTLVKAESNQDSVRFSPTPYLEVAEIAFSGQRRAVALADGAYGQVVFRRASFADAREAIRGEVSGPVEGVAVTECKFENVRSAANFRIRISRNIKVADSEFRNVSARAITVGALSRADNRYAEITNNTIVNMEQPDSRTHVIGILSYVHETLIAGNTIKNAYSQHRHEAISSRGSDTVIRDNTIINAGGRTAAISLAARGPTLIENNLIQFTDEHKGGAATSSWNGMDLRQAKVRVVGNRILGTQSAIVSRRGVKGMVIEDNYIGDSARQSSGIVISINTGGTIPEDSMGDLTIRGNTFSGIAKEEGEGRFVGVVFSIRNHRGEHDSRMDDVVVADNVFRDIQVANGSAGVHFEHLGRSDSHMRNVSILRNDFGPLDVPVTDAKRHVEDLQISDE